MKNCLLYVAPFYTVPPSTGASLRGLNLLTQLLPDYKVYLLTYSDNKSPEIEEWARQKHVTISYFLPQRDTSNSYFQRLFSAYPPGLPHIMDVANAIDQEWGKSGPFNVIYIATQILGAALLKKRWPAKIILDLYDVYYPIYYKKFSETSISQPYYWLFLIEFIRVRAYEKRLFQLADQILVPAQEDVVQILRLTPQPNIAVIPNGVNLPNLDSQKPNSHTILMVAFYGYSPNAEGFLWFYNRVWPIVRRSEPDAKLCLVGDGANFLENATHNDHSIEWVGKVDDLAPYYKQATCAIVPILSGGGTKLKLLEAMAWSVPVVATPMGVRGVDHQGTVTVVEEEQDFAQSIIACIRQPAQYREQALRSRQVAANLYTWDEIGAVLRKCLK